MEGQPENCREMLNMEFRMNYMKEMKQMKEAAAEISDCAYYKSSSNRRSHSSTSTNSKSQSQSSGSSGYGGGVPAPSGKTQSPNVRRCNNTDSKKKKCMQMEIGLIKGASTSTNETAEPTDGEPMIVDDNDSYKTVDMCLSPAVSSTVESNRSDLQSPDGFRITDDGFSCLMTMRDGVVIYTTSSLTTSLGFPKDMWLGRSLIDFIHPHDNDTFALQMTEEKTSQETDSAMVKASDVDLEQILRSVTHSDKAKKPEILPAVAGTLSPTSSIMCRFRRYRSLITGYNIKETPVTYAPFHLHLTFKNVTDDKGSANYLVVQATPIKSAYQESFELIKDAVPFIIRHTVDGLVKYIDIESVPYLGYMPQHIINTDALKLYHKDDLFYITHIYENIVKEGSMGRSEPYRMLAQNGKYLKVETEWSSFINPWSKKLEFVTGKHYVMEGPEDPDVFQQRPLPKKLTARDMAGNKDAQFMRNNIVYIMTEKPYAAMHRSLYLQDDYSDSKSSSGAGSSYTTLNYNENLQRYFKSQEPYTDELAEIAFKIHKQVEQKPHLRYRLSSSNESGDMSSDSGSIGRGAKRRDGSDSCVSLTTSLLSKHNKTMQKAMIMNHRSRRVNNRRHKREVQGRVAIWCDAAYRPPKSDKSESFKNRGVKRVSSVSSLTLMRHAKQQCVMPAQTSRQPDRTSTITNAVLSFVNAMKPAPTPNTSDSTTEFMPAPKTPPRKPISSAALPLSIENYEQACKISEQMNNDFSERRSRQRSERKMFPIKNLCRENLHATNALNRSTEAVPEWQLLRGVHHRSSDDNQTSDSTNDFTDVESSYSSFYSSLLRTNSDSYTDSSDRIALNVLDEEEESESADEKPPIIKRRGGAPWNENVHLNQELIYEYQVVPKALEETLENDNKLIMDGLEQPILVNDQLEQLYWELHIENGTARMSLEDDHRTSEEEEHPPKLTTEQINRRYSNYGLVYEEDAAMPVPITGDTLLVPIALTTSLPAKTETA